MPYPPGGTAVVKLDHATAPVGAFTVGAVPQALKVVVEAAPPESVNLKLRGRSVRVEMSSDPGPTGTLLGGGDSAIPEILVAARPPAEVILALDSGVRRICSAWLDAVIPG
jgi:hypothetical protein